MAVSRQREYLADASGALLTCFPEALVSDLEKSSSDTDPLDQATKATDTCTSPIPFRPTRAP